MSISRADEQRGVSRQRKLDALDEGQGFLDFGEEGLVGLEGGGVDLSAEASHADGMLEVEHLMVEQILDGIARAGGAVEDAADDDGVVGGIVVAERSFGYALAPGEVGPAQQSVEEAEVERLKDLVEVVVVPFGTGVEFAAAGGADALDLLGHVGRGGKALVAGIVGGVDGFAIDLGHQNVQDGTDDRLRSSFEQVREADLERTLAQPDGGVERGETAEAQSQRREGRPRAQEPILFFVDGLEIDGH